MSHEDAVLKEWGFLPELVPNPEESIKFIANGAPTEPLVYKLISNSDYHKLWINGNKATLFAHISSYMNEPFGQCSLPGDPRDFNTDKHYLDGCRIPVRSWDNIQKVIPGISQSMCTYVHEDGWSGTCSWPNHIYDGNTCILQLSQSDGVWSYVLVGGEQMVTYFKLDEPIENFYSYVADNDVPLPLVVTATKVVLPESGSYLDRSLLQGYDLRNIARALSANEIPEADCEWHRSKEPVVHDRVVVNRSYNIKVDLDDGEP